MVHRYSNISFITMDTSCVRLTDMRSICGLKQLHLSFCCFFICFFFFSSYIIEVSKNISPFRARNPWRSRLSGLVLVCRTILYSLKIIVNTIDNCVNNNENFANSYIIFRRWISVRNWPVPPRPRPMRLGWNVGL